MRRHFRSTLAIAVLAGALSAAAAPAADEPASKFKAGDHAPDFTLADVGGRQVRLSETTRDTVVLLAFWSLRCEACLREVPYLEQIRKSYAGKAVAVLSVVIDGTDAAATKALMQSSGARPGYPVLVDPDFAVSDTYTSFVVPHTLVIDRTGVVRYVHTGFEPGAEKEYKAALDRALRR